MTVQKYEKSNEFSMELHLETPFEIVLSRRKEEAQQTKGDYSELLSETLHLHLHQSLVTVLPSLWCERGH